MFSKLSILIPCYNEAATIASVIERVAATDIIYPLKKEIIVIDDGSTDNTSEILEAMAIKSFPQIILIKNKQNSGKGYSIMAALREATGEVIVVQDADMEYDPSDYNKMLRPIIEGHADVVLGSRFRGDSPHRVLFYFHTVGNKLLTFLSNLFTQLNLTDMETGYKMFKSDILKQIKIKERRFGFEPEIIAKISRIEDIRIYEVGIAYYGRTYKQGKKIKWSDGFRAIWCIIKYNIFSRT